MASQHGIMDLSQDLHFIEMALWLSMEQGNGRNLSALHEHHPADFSWAERALKQGHVGALRWCLRQPQVLNAMVAQVEWVARQALRELVLLDLPIGSYRPIPAATLMEMLEIMERGLPGFSDKLLTNAADPDCWSAPEGNGGPGSALLQDFKLRVETASAQGPRRSLRL